MTAAAASPPDDSSPLVGWPSRMSALTTSTGWPGRSAARNAPTLDRIAPPKSNAATSESRRSAAWIAVAFVLSRYAGAAVANVSARGSAPGALFSASRAASTPIVVVSSS